MKVTLIEWVGKELISLIQKGYIGGTIGANQSEYNGVVGFLYQQATAAYATARTALKNPALTGAKTASAVTFISTFLKDEAKVLKDVTDKNIKEKTAVFLRLLFDRISAEKSEMIKARSATNHNEGVYDGLLLVCEQVLKELNEFSDFYYCFYLASEDDDLKLAADQQLQRNALIAFLIKQHFLLRIDYWCFKHLPKGLYNRKYQDTVIEGLNLIRREAFRNLSDPLISQSSFWRLTVEAILRDIKILELEKSSALNAETNGLIAGSRSFLIPLIPNSSPHLAIVAPSVSAVAGAAAAPAPAASATPAAAPSAAAKPTSTTLPTAGPAVGAAAGDNVKTAADGKAAADFAATGASGVAATANAIAPKAEAGNDKAPNSAQVGASLAASMAAAGESDAGADEEADVDADADAEVDDSAGPVAPTPPAAGPSAQPPAPAPAGVRTGAGHGGSGGRRRGGRRR